MSDFTDFKDFRLYRLLPSYHNYMPSKITQSKSHGRSVLRIYFLLMTLVGVIGTLIALGFFLYSIGKKVIITNDEYIVGERYYELDQCSNSIINDKQTVTPSKEDIAKCKEEKKVTLIQARSALFKEDMLSGAIRTILFFVLLMVHYPRFMRFNKKD